MPCGRVLNVREVFDDPQVKHIGAAATVRHPRLSAFHLVNQAVKLSRTPASMASATPELGEHTAEVLGELGYDAAGIARLNPLLSAVVEVFDDAVADPVKAGAQMTVEARAGTNRLVLQLDEAQVRTGLTVRSGEVSFVAP